jgi:hypothetical protein
MYGGGYFRLKPMTDANATKDTEAPGEKFQPGDNAKKRHKPPINHPWRRSCMAKAAAYKRQ